MHSLSWRDYIALYGLLPGRSLSTLGTGSSVHSALDGRSPGKNMDHELALTFFLDSPCTKDPDITIRGLLC